jgi:hypothetical protein
MPEEEQEIARALLHALIIKNQVSGAIERVTKPATKETKLPSRREEGEEETANKANN